MSQQSSNVFRVAAISAAVQNVQLEMHNTSRRLEDDNAPQNVKDYISNVQLPRFRQVLETLEALKSE